MIQRSGLCSVLAASVLPDNYNCGI